MIVQGGGGRQIQSVCGSILSAYMNHIGETDSDRQTEEVRDEHLIESFDGREKH